MSLSMKYAMRKRQKMAKGGGVASDEDYNHVKGVNQSIFPAKSKFENKANQGASEAGMYLRGPDHLKKTGMEKAKRLHKETLEEMHSIKKPNLMAKGGEVSDDKGTWHSPAGGSANRAKGAARARNEDKQAGVHKAASIYTPGVSDSGYHQRGGLNAEHIKKKHEAVLGEAKSSPRPTEGKSGFAEGGEVDGNMEDADMIARIMHKRKMYSEGGMVANDDEPIADEMPAQFDDLALRDGLEEHETGANSGDELGDEDQDERDHDIVNRIMKSRGKKDKMPRPA